MFNESFGGDSIEALQIYTLNTVTYGTTCALYLEMRCLRHLTTQPETITRQAAVEALFHFYMDNVLTGSHTVEQAVKIRRELYNQNYYKQQDFHSRNGEPMMRES